MKLNGKTVKPLNEEVVVLPRSGTDPETGDELADLAFIFHSVPNMDEFNRLCPEPKPRSYITPAGSTVSRPDFSDPAYKKDQVEHGAQMMRYLFIRSILATPCLEFETVVLDKPETWKNVEKELADAGVSMPELNRLYEASHKVNGLSDTAIEVATERFLRGRRLQR